MKLYYEMGIGRARVGFMPYNLLAFGELTPRSIKRWPFLVRWA